MDFLENIFFMDHILGEISVQEVTKKDPIKAVQLYILNLLSKKGTLICGFSDFIALQSTVVNHWGSNIKSFIANKAKII